MTTDSLTLLVATITLVIVCFQTVYAKKALEAAKVSIDLAKTSRQLEKLPDMHVIIQVTILNKWLDELNAVMEYIEEKIPRKSSNY